MLAGYTVAVATVYFSNMGLSRVFCGILAPIWGFKMLAENVDFVSH